MLKSKKGFTLVELLIVIVVIGILSAMMMLSSTEAVSSAKAARIISDLTNWKKAVLAWYVDNIDRIDSSGRVRKSDGSYGYFGNAGTITLSEIAKYFSAEMKATGGTSDTTLGSTSPTGVKDNASGGQYIPDYKNGSDSVAGKRWFIVFAMPNSYTNDTRLKSKLESRATAAGLWVCVPGAGDLRPYTASDARSGYVAVEVMDFTK